MKLETRYWKLGSADAIPAAGKQQDAFSQFRVSNFKFHRPSAIGMEKIIAIPIRFVSDTPACQVGLA